jgi:hypothetical protein
VATTDVYGPDHCRLNKGRQHSHVEAVRRGTGRNADGDSVGQFPLSQNPPDVDGNLRDA